MKKRLVTCILLLCTLCLWSMPMEHATEYVHDDDFPFIIITKDDVQELPEMNDREFYRYSLNVVFQVNKSDIRRDDPFLGI